MSLLASFAPLREIFHAKFAKAQRKMLSTMLDFGKVIYCLGEKSHRIVFLSAGMLLRQ